MYSIKRNFKLIMILKQQKNKQFNSGHCQSLIKLAVYGRRYFFFSCRYLINYVVVFALNHIWSIKTKIKVHTKH